MLSRVNRAAPEHRRQLRGRRALRLPALDDLGRGAAALAVNLLAPVQIVTELLDRLLRAEDAHRQRIEFSWPCPDQPACRLPDEQVRAMRIHPVLAHRLLPRELRRHVVVPGICTHPHAGEIH